MICRQIPLFSLLHRTVTVNYGVKELTVKIAEHISHSECNCMK